MDRVSLRERLRYRVDALVERGGFVIFTSLVVAFVFVFVAAIAVRAILILIAPDELASSVGGIADQIFVVFLEMTDPGSMALDIRSNAMAKTFAVVIGLIGIVMLSALIAFITTALDQRLSELRKGRSRVVEHGHTLILGWSPQQVVEIIRELIVANESEDDGVVVVLGDLPKEAMDDHLKLHLPERGATRIVTRSGNTAVPASLELVNLASAMSVIVVSEVSDTASDGEKASADARVIKTLLAVVATRPDHVVMRIVTEIHDAGLIDVARSISPEEITIIDGADILAKILVQTSRSIGLSFVYNEILSFEGAEMYFFAADWGATSFEDASLRFADGVPLGYRRDGEVVLNPPVGVVLEDGDELLMLATDDSTLEYSDRPVAFPSVREPIGRRVVRRREHELIVGWSCKCPTILAEYAQYVVTGSQIDVMVKNPSDDLAETIATLNTEISGLEICLLEADSLDPGTWDDIDVAQYANILIVSSAEEARQADRIDADTIVTLLILRRHLSVKETSSKTKLIAELVESENEHLVVHAGVHDFVVSTRFVSMVLAQISEDVSMVDVYESLFRPEGSEVYLKSVDLYFTELPIDVTFADVMSAVRARAEICMGVVCSNTPGRYEQGHGLRLIPEKRDVIRLSCGDLLVVLAEDDT